MVRGAKVFGILGAVASVALGASACDPPVRVGLTVTTTANGADDHLGDGACTSARAAGACTLQAAIEEANAAPQGADISVPSGSYGGFDPTVTGDVRIDGTVGGGTVLHPMRVTVAPAGRLEVNWVQTGSDDDSGGALLAFEVSGLLRLHNSTVAVLPGAGLDPVAAAVAVRAGGTAAVQDSWLVGAGTEAGAVVNGGRFIGVRSTFTALGRWGVAFVTQTGGESHLQASGIHGTGVNTTGGCSGPGPISHGYLHTWSSAPIPACNPTESPTDLTGDPLWSFTSVSAASPLVDAIPLDDPACDTGAVDAVGTPRGVDGDGDGIGGCDVGAVERLAG